MTYPSDQRGIYQVLHKYVSAWDGQQPGWCVVEVRRYEDGVILSHRGEPRYGMTSMLRIYIAARDALMGDA